MPERHFHASEPGPGRSLSTVSGAGDMPAGGQSLLGSGGLSTFGLAFAAAGAFQASVGAYYGAISQRYALRSRALDLKFQGSNADINARSAEVDAATAAQAGKNQKARVTLQHGQTKATGAARQAGAGVQAGVGSAAEVQASIELAKEIDSLTISRNTMRATHAARTRAVNFRNQGTLSRVSAQNVNEAAGSISPFSSAFSSLLGSAGRISSTFLSGAGR